MLDKNQRIMIISIFLLIFVGGYVTGYLIGGYRTNNQWQKYYEFEESGIGILDEPKISWNLNLIDDNTTNTNITTT